MTTIAVLGTGNIGGTLARTWVAAGHDVTLGARDPEKGSVRHLAQELGVARARLADAAARAEVVLFAVPGAAMPDTISQAGAKIDGKIVIDAANNVSAAVAHSADLITAAAPSALYHRAFNTLGWELFAEPTIGDVQVDHFFCGPDGPSRAVVEQLIADVGLHPIWVGGPEEAGVVDAMLRIWLTLAMKRGYGRHIGFKLLT
jgi:predicted dinucleotide-binding enzyme